MKKPSRRVLVFTSLVGVLTLTSALLLAIAPAPLNPEASSTLLAIDTPDALEVVFKTQQDLKPGRWKYIYIHHSRTVAGNAMNNEPGVGQGDHFVIGNGQGAPDGQIQVCQRWEQQTSAAPPVGATEIDPSSISICLVGDFDRSVPTPMQLKRLTSLIQALQGRLNLRSQDVLLLNQPNSAVGMGRYFPTTAFREDLLP